MDGNNKFKLEFNELKSIPSRKSSTIRDAYIISYIKPAYLVD